ncbi:hypothetical protein N7456_009408 [Penicillium angulare]|uniref:Fe2OG dioxygenase domain-containing protein n=1 Tax=Penicillium angulare TaxID=116970 RepID=A0A9W9F4V8_9EURO|nr:hypothetical protein N7456_009408 [Penicillium angulare]
MSTSITKTAAFMPAAPSVHHISLSTERATRPNTTLPQYLLNEVNIEKKSFDPEEHLSYVPPTSITTMKDIGREGQGISTHAVSAPFQLFNEAAIKQMRAEIFSKEVLDNCRYKSQFVKDTIRGMGSARAPFICDAWNSPEVLEKISAAAGVDLIPAMDYEIAAINISVSDGTKSAEAAKEAAEEQANKDLSTFPWHYDSYPFVCVTMLSDCSEMAGGETAVKLSNGDIVKVRGPAMGTCVVMQGRYIEHAALQAFGGAERISMVTSFRAKSPHIRDDTVLAGVRPISNLSELYTQYSEYRIELFQERLKDRLKQEQRRVQSNRPFNIPSMQRFLAEQKQFIESMMEELIE